MKSQTFQLYFRSILSVLVLGFFVFVSLHPSFAQEQESSENPTPEIPQEILPENSTEPQIEEQNVEIFEEITGEIPTENETTEEEIVVETQVENTFNAEQNMPPIPNPTPITSEEIPQIQEETFFEEVENFLEDVFVQPYISPYTPPTLTTRQFNKRTPISYSAPHSCLFQTFRIDVTGKKREIATIGLNKTIENDFELEIGSIPNGIDLRFLVNEDYSYTPLPQDTLLELVITNEKNSQKGDFTVPVFFTKKGDKEITTVCQINIVNM